MKEIFHAAHHETIRTVPFNSIGKIIMVEGGTYPEAFGGNCVMQARELTRLAVAGGLSADRIKYASGQQRPHWVAFAEDDGIHKGKLLMSDPYFMHTEPIDISEVMGRGRVLQRAYPLRGEASSMMEVVATGPRSFDAHLWAMRQNATGGSEIDPTSGLKKVHTYTYDLDTLTDELPPNRYQLLAGLKQKNLEMGVLRADQGVTRVYLEPEQGRFNMLKVGEQKLDRQKNGQVERFDDEMARIAAELGATAEQLYTFFNEGRAAYLRRKPTDHEVGVTGSWEGQSDLLNK